MGGAVVGDLFFVIGGEGSVGGEYRLHDEVEVYVAAAGTWVELPPMPMPRHGLFATAVGDTVFLPGGGQGLEPVATNDVLIIERTP